MRLTALAWRGLADRPLRTGLTLVGVALGVGIICATLIANQAATEAVAHASAELFGRASLRVRAFNDEGLTPRAVTLINRLPGVTAAAAVAQRRLTLSTLPGPEEQVFSLLAIGVDPGNEPKVRSYDLIAGRFLSTPAASSPGVNEVLVNATWAADHNLAVGDDLLLTGDRRPGPPRLRIAGTLGDVGFGALGAGAVAVVPRSTLEAAFPVPTPIVAVDLVVDAGHDAEVRQELDQTLTEPFSIETVADAADELGRAQQGFAGIAFLFGLVALAVGAFLVANTLAMTLSERTREVGLLRAAGTTSRQVVGIFLRQAAVLGIAGSAVGVVAGIGLAAAMIAFLRATRAVLIAGLPLNPQALLFAFVVGAAVTVGAAGIPAVAAARIGPLDALRPSRQPGRSIVQQVRWLIGLELVVVIVGVLAYPLARGNAALPAVLLAMAVLIGGATGAALLVEPIGRVVGRPFEVFFGAQGLLGRANLGRDRVRSGLTVGALLIGLAAVVALGTVAESARSTAQRWVDSVLPGGYGIRLGIKVDVDEFRPTFEATSGVRYASPIVEFPAVERVGNQQPTATSLAGIDPTVFEATGSLIFTDGDRATAFAELREGGAILVPEPIARRDHLSLGATVRLGLPARPGTAFRVVGIVAYSIPSRSGEGAILMSLADAKSHFSQHEASLWAMVPQPGITAAAFQDAVAETALDLSADTLTAAGLADELSRSLDRLVGLFDALALIAVVIAALGIVNTLSVGVVERVREIAILRSHGMTVGQVQAMIVAEAAIMGAIGSLAAAVVGVAVAWALVSVGAASDFGLLVVPWLLLAVTVLLGIGVAALAGIYPARVAARLPIVPSLTHFE
jgi:putative ABC transport system permease protein